MCAAYCTDTGKKAKPLTKGRGLAGRGLVASGLIQAPTARRRLTKQKTLQIDQEEEEGKEEEEEEEEEEKEHLPSVFVKPV